MATRAKIHIARREEGVSFSEIPEKVMVSIYNHFDGYPEGLGVTLASYLEDKKITWEKSYEILKEHIDDAVDNYGPDSIAMYGSGQFHTEDYYMAQKLFKGAIGTNNFDANSRLCMSSAVAGYNKSFGSDGPPCCYEDIDYCSTILLVGTNTADCHPVLFAVSYTHLTLPTSDLV